MKGIFLIATVLFIGLSIFAQSYILNNNLYKDLRFEVRGKYTRAITKGKLSKAKSLEDIIPYYAHNWISDYISVEIWAYCDGIARKGMGPNDFLNVEQKDILNTIDLGSELIINVNYTYNNPFTDSTEHNSMNIVMTVVPEIEAEYKAGPQAMIEYLEENAMDKISDSTLNYIQQWAVLFTVNEKGKITNAKISMSTGDAKTDSLFLEAINNMPEWKPAETREGKKVKQEFVFRIGNRGC